MRAFNRGDLPVIQMAFDSVVRSDKACGEQFGGQKLKDAEVTLAWDDMTDQTARVHVVTPQGEADQLINYAEVYWPADRAVRPADVTDAVGTAIATALLTANTPSN